jgi:hypothetical protein
MGRGAAARINQVRSGSIMGEDFSLSLRLGKAPGFCLLQRNMIRMFGLASAEL